jgi:hypothetical protein
MEEHLGCCELGESGVLESDADADYMTIQSQGPVKMDLPSDKLIQTMRLLVPVTF